MGKVKDVTINVVIQYKEEPASSMFIKCHIIVVDGFMGIEQITDLSGNIPERKIRNRLSHL